MSSKNRSISYILLFFFFRIVYTKSQVSASFFPALHCQVFSSARNGISRTRRVRLRNATSFRQSFRMAQIWTICLIALWRIYTNVNTFERITRKSRVNDSVCSARMCNKIELAIDWGETSGNYQRGRKKRPGSYEIFIRWRDRYVASKR